MPGPHSPEPARLALALPGLSLWLPAAPLRLGDRWSTRWRVAAGRFEELSIELLGREVAERRRGGQLQTVEACFHRRPLVRGSIGLEAGAGAAIVRIPPHSMHSFSAPHHRILWEVRVEARSLAGDAIDERLAVQVAPRDPELEKPE